MTRRRPSTSRSHKSQTRYFIVWSLNNNVFTFNWICMSLANTIVACESVNNEYSQDECIAHHQWQLRNASSHIPLKSSWLNSPARLADTNWWTVCCQSLLVWPLSQALQHCSCSHQPLETLHSSSHWTRTIWGGFKAGPSPDSQSMRMSQIMTMGWHRHIDTQGPSWCVERRDAQRNNS